MSTWTLKNITHQVAKLEYKFVVKMMNQSIRWAFNAERWIPSKEEILAASSFIQAEEKERISKFVFLNDAKTSLLGRLMLRKYTHLATSIPYEEIKFGRDHYGKPYLLGVGDTTVSFNVSHQGDFVVLAGDPKRNIGIDVMKVEPVLNKDIQEFFQLMNRQFSPTEWQTIRSYHTEMEQVGCFYRIWCLKESYVKNRGFGITVPLQNISFSLKTLKLKIGDIITDTVLYENNVLMKDWIFEETLVDDKHAVAVSIKMNDNTDHVPVQYTFLTFADLVKEAKLLTYADHKFADDFMSKQMKSY